MAREFEVKIRLTADNQATAEIVGVEKSLGGIETAAASASAGLGTASAAVLGTVSALKVLIAASAEQEDALKKLDSALALKGVSQFGSALREQADELQRTTRFSDDAVNSAQALIATYGVAGDQLALATQAAADLSARLGIDLDTAARQVAGTVNGFTRGLDKVVPALKGMSDEALKTGAGIIAVADAMKGGAVDAAQTLSGQYEILKNAFGELIEKSGDWLVQNSLVANGLQSIVVGVQDATKAVSDGGNEYEKAARKAEELRVAQDAAAKAAEQMAIFNERNNRVMRESAAATTEAAKIAKELGITLETEVIAKREREAALYERLAELGRQGIDVRIAEQESLERLGSSTEDLNAARLAGLPIIQNQIAAEQALARQVIFTAQAFDYLARTQGNAAAVGAAIEAGGRIVNAGSNGRGGRVTLPGGGSRLLHPTSFGRFGG